MTFDGPDPGQTSLHDMRIVVVDDEPANTTLLAALLRRWQFTDIVAITDPTHVVGAFTDLVPDLLLLDVNMPVLSGFDVMRLLAPWTHGSTPVPVLVLTADITAETKREALTLGARDFLTKPFDPEEVRLRVSNLLQMRQLQLALKAHGDELEERVQQRTRQLERSRLEVVERLALAAEYRDDATSRHAQRIGHTASLIAAGLALTNRDGERIRRAAPLHDIGKIAIPDSILLKPGKLTADEFQIVKSHTLIGARILAGSQSGLLRVAQEIALTHHERWDGNGYPTGLAGARIPVAGRIVAVADVFDALTHARPYKEAWPVSEAAANISDHGGRQFDPDIVKIFESLDHHALLAGDSSAGIAAPTNGSMTVNA
ncbi:MAG: cyclic di-GMP phosphodiesterase [Solirubrobacteraceae bacterium]|jgi:putative two-component system response regulator|nr:cyclic di-GMP phosphodiesterase [Solirubrobacteraceae bacterium]